MSEDSFELTPFADEEPAFINPPALPDVTNNEPLGSGIVTRVLGQGGMANVYEIWVPQLEVFRAVKIIKPESTKDAKERFQTEIKILAKLIHPNIVDIHNVGEWKGMQYIEMEKIDGVALDQVIRSRGALSPKVCTAIGILVCRALAFSHAQEYAIYGKTYEGIIHRDLKPGNIMICPNGILKLMDFGIARPADASFHTIDGAIVGTIQYMSPELLNGKSLDFRTDIYALGATLYEVLTGMNAFPEPNFSKLVTMKQKNQYRPLNDFKISLPSRLRRLIYKCMQEERKKRVDSTEKLLYELEKIHRQMTHELPEEILKQFYQKDPGERNVPVLGRVIPWKPLIGIPMSILMIGIFLYWSVFFVKNKIADYRQFLTPAPIEKVKIVEKIVHASEEKTGTTESAGRQKQHTKSSTVQKQPETVASLQKSPGDVISQPEDNKKEVSKPVTLVERLAKQYGTSDVMDMLEREYAAGRLSTALRLYDKLSPNQARQNRAKIYKMRILQELGRTKQLARFLSGNTINDGEFFLAQAKLAYKRGEVVKTRILLQKSLNAPKQFSDYNTLKQQVYYYQALCASKAFDRNPTEQYYLKALEEWRNLGALFSTNRNHKLFLEYRKETRRIGEKYRAAQK